MAFLYSEQFPFIFLFPIIDYEIACTGSVIMLQRITIPSTLYNTVPCKIAFYIEQLFSLFLTPSPSQAKLNNIVRCCITPLVK